MRYGANELFLSCTVAAVHKMGINGTWQCAAQDLPCDILYKMKDRILALVLIDRDVLDVVKY